MHRIIDDIISSTENRVKNIKDTDTKKVLATRSLVKSIQSVRDKNGVPVIAEVKPASPTTHNREVSPDDAAQIARTMEQAGATAISVLTEPDFFHGSLENLEHVRKAVNIPVLRKDFIIDEKQLYEVHSDLILLIAGILGNRLPGFIALAKSRGLQPLVEVHDK
ncbi:MAG: indole-3-glycerol-phosphate synthase, partial [Methanosarcinales archaeon]|nr:indole-3-glycerol-phosphate synthase [Methanosarcinales archaeon]